MIAAAGTYERAQHERWVSFALSELDAWLWHTFTMSMRLKEEERSPAVVAHNKSMWSRAVAVTVEPHLAQHDYFVGDAFSCADIVMAWSLNWGRRQGLLQEFPATTRYMSRMLAMPHCALSKDDA